MNVHFVTWRGCGVHPVDLLRVAILSRSEYVRLIDECRQRLTAEIFAEVNRRTDRLVCKEDGYYLVPYLSLFDGLPVPHDMLEALWRMELYDGNGSLTDFQQWLNRRWSRFPKKAVEEGFSDALHIFEAVSLQYPVMEMLGYHLMEAKAISEFINQLLKHVLTLDPFLLYIDVSDTATAVINAARERVGWLPSYEAWLSSTPYAGCHGLSGLDGVIAFCEERRKIETYVVDHLPIKHLTVVREVLSNK